MPIAIILLSVLLLPAGVLSELPYGDQIASGLCELANHYGLPLSQHLISGALNYGMGAACEECEKFDEFTHSVSLGVHSFQYCRSTGRSDGECAAFSTACELADAAKNALNPFSEVIQIFPSVSNMCEGKPAFKCCRTKSGCHSAFNEPAPINCEGNPAYGPTYTAGPCIGGGLFKGCTCDYLSECKGPFDHSRVCHDGDSSVQKSAPSWRSDLESVFFAFEGRQQRAPQNPPGNSTNQSVPLYRIDEHGMVHWTPGIWNQTNSTPADYSGLSHQQLQGRRWSLLHDLYTTMFRWMGEQATNQSINAARSVPVAISPLIDLATRRGCKNYTNFLSNAPVWEGPTPAKGAKGSPIDELYTHWQSFGIMGVLRLTNAVPFFWDRYDFAQRWIWSDYDINRYLFEAGKILPSTNISAQDRNVLAQRALLEFLSPASIALLQQTLPFTWMTLAVPIPKVEDRAKKHYSRQYKGVMDGCAIGSSPRFSNVSLSSANGLDFVLTFALSDAKDADVGNDRFGLPFSVTWGDGSLTSERLHRTVAAEEETHLVKLHHRYNASTSPPVVNVSLEAVNAAGLRAQAVATATLSVSSSSSQHRHIVADVKVPPVGFLVNSTLQLHSWFGSGTTYETWHAYDFGPAALNAVAAQITDDEQQLARILANLTSNTTTPAERKALEAEAAALRQAVAQLKAEDVYEKSYRQSFLGASAHTRPGYTVASGYDHYIDEVKVLGVAGLGILNCSNYGGDKSSSAGNCTITLRMDCLAEPGYVYGWARHWIRDIGWLRGDGVVQWTSPTRVDHITYHPNGTWSLTPISMASAPHGGKAYPCGCTRGYPMAPYLLHLSANAADYEAQLLPTCNASASGALSHGGNCRPVASNVLPDPLYADEIWPLGMIERKR